MSEKPPTPDLVRLARQAYEAVIRGDFDAVMSVFAADAVYDLSDAGLGTFEGAEAIRGFNEDWFRSWEEYRFEVDELVGGARYGRGFLSGGWRRHRVVVRSRGAWPPLWEG